MKLNKILALVLALVMLLSVLAACDTDKPVETQPKETKPAQTQPGNNDPVETTEDDTISFPLKETLDVSVMMVMSNAAYSYNDNLVWQELQEYGNINFEVTEFPASEAKEKMNLLMTGGNYPEVLFKTHTYLDYDKYGNDGILLPLEDLIREYCPNLTAELDAINGWGEISSPDGHIYQLPMIQRAYANGTGGNTYWINQRWLDKLNLPMPTNQEELYNVLKAFKEQDPNGNGIADEVPFVPYIGTTQQSLCGLVGWFGDGLWYDNYWMVNENNEMYYLPKTEYFKENIVKFFAKLYQEGLMAEDCYTLKQEQYRAVCGSGEDIYGLVYDSSVNYFADEAVSMGFVSLKPFNSESFSLNMGLQKGGFALTDKCQNPEELMAWVDYLYSEEGGRLFRMGIEDVSYKINADGSYTTIEEGFEDVTYQCTLMGAATVPGRVPDLYYDGAETELDAHTNNEMYGEGYGAFSEGVHCPAVVYADADEKSHFAAMHTDILAYLRNYIAECITGVIDVEETWDDFQKTLKEMGVDELEQIRADAYQRALGNK